MQRHVKKGSYKVSEFKSCNKIFPTNSNAWNPISNNKPFMWTFAALSHYWVSHGIIFTKLLSREVWWVREPWMTVNIAQILKRAWVVVIMFIIFSNECKDAKRVNNTSPMDINRLLFYKTMQKISTRISCCCWISWWSSRGSCHRASLLWLAWCRRVSWRRIT